MRATLPAFVLVLAVLATARGGEPSADPEPLATSKRVATADGATIALHHHPGRGAPALLVHGISSNHRFFDLDAEHSFADWLVDRGWDVWMLDLRGHGDAMYDEEDRRQWAGWTVDDYGRYDIPAAVERIRLLTGYDEVAYVGHSMGGMVAAIYLQSVDEPHLSSLSVVGSPAAFSPTDPLFGAARTTLAAGGALTLAVDTPGLAGVAADLGPWSPGRLHERLYNPDNLSRSTQKALLRTVVSPLSRREMAHFARMIEAGRFLSFDRSVDWGAGMGRIQVPTLVVAGTADRVALPERVRAYHDQVGGPKALVEAEGYGHLDLLLGEDAEEEVFPHLLRWMEAHR